MSLVPSEKCQKYAIILGDQCDFVAPLSHKVQGGRLYALNVHKIRKHGEHNMDGTECEICHFNFMTNNGLLGKMKNHALDKQEQFVY